MGFWDSPYPGQPVDPGMPPGYQPPVDPLIAAMLAQQQQRAAAQNWEAPGAEIPMSGMGATPDQQAAAASIWNRFSAPFIQAETLPQRVLEGQPVDPVSEGLNFAGAVTMPSLGRAAMAGSVPRDLMSMSGAADKPGIIAYHGSPHDFDAFDISKIGTGEGAQAYGHGLYFAEREGTAKSYRDQLESSTFSHPVYGENLNVDNVDHGLMAAARKGAYGYDSTAGSLLPESTYEKIGTNITEALRQGDSLDDMRKFVAKSDWEPVEKAAWQSALNEGKNYTHSGTGKMYQVQINADPSHFLDWDKPLSEQSQKVQQALRNSGLMQGDLESEMRSELARRTQSDDTGPALQKWYDELREQAKGDLSDADQDRNWDMQRVITNWWDNGIESNEHGAGGVFDPTGSEIHRQISERLTDSPNIVGSKNQPTAAEALRDAGIPGIKYLDAGSRGKGDGQGSHNYVTFSDDIISILKKYGLAGLGLAGYGAAQGQSPQPNQ